MSEAQPPKLRVAFDSLCIGDTMLIRRYDAGDCDVVPWPLEANDPYWTQDKWNEALAATLYDAREMGNLPSDTRAVELPDGTIFVIEDHVK